MANISSEPLASSLNKESTAPSYASAVLNFKTSDSNKENINNPSNSSETDNSLVKNTQVKAVSGTSSKTKPPKGGLSSTNSSKHEPASEYPGIESGSKGKNLKTKQEKEVVCETGENECAGDNDKNAKQEAKKFVEAPLPKVNPWTVNKNAASVIKGTAANKAHTADAADKRVLQPHTGPAGNVFFLLIYSLEKYLFLQIVLNNLIS